MNQLFVATALAIGLGFATPAMAAPEAGCRALWDKADVVKTGILEGKMATPYLDAIKKSGKTYNLNVAGQISETEFMTVCGDDTFKNVTASR